MRRISATEVDKAIQDCADWAAFYRLAAGQSEQKAKGDLFERLTQLYLQTHPEYRSVLKSVWINGRDDIPDRVRKATGLPKPDEGIDLIAETNAGEFWAIQSKFRSDKDQALTTGDLAKFTSLAFVTCRNIALGVVSHTSAKPVKKKHLLGRTVEIGLGRWLDITHEDWDAIRSATRGPVGFPKPRTARPHQVDAINAARRHFLVNKSSRGRLIMPCGTGKSLTAFWIAEALKAKTILVAVPSLALIKQGLADWPREYLAHGIIPDWLCVCGDESVGATEKDEFVSSTYDTGIPTTTATTEIATFLKSPSSKVKIVFTTYQSSHRLASATRAARFSFDLCILDEAHKTVGVKSKRFATLLFDKKVRIKKRLFMTATERVLRGSNDEVLSMSDSDLYGDRFHLLTFKSAIADKIISDYRILTVSVSDAQVEKLVRENRLLSPKSGRGREYDARSVAAGVALMRAYRGHGVHHALSFHRSIASADEFREQQDRMNSVRSLGVRAVNLHISSKRSAGERASLLKDFAARRRALMTNARCLTEGVDIPCIDAVLFADPKQSTIDIVQSAGRALRRYEGKDYGYLLLPLVIPSGQDIDEFAESTAFRQVARTIAALSTQDERIAEEFRATTHARQPTGNIVQFTGDVPVGVRVDFDAFADSISTKIWESVGRANFRRFADARTFVRGLGLKDTVEWRNYSRSAACPPDIPASPERVYAHAGWAGVGDWLGTGVVAARFREFRSFEQARSFARKLGLKSREDWLEYVQTGHLPADIPANPRTYTDGWRGWGDWLGTGAVANQTRRFRSFERARAYVRKLGLKSQTEWFRYTMSGHLPRDIPTAPSRTYRDKGWVGWGDWFGSGVVATQQRRYRPLDQARAFVRELGLRSGQDWRNYMKTGKLPPDIPADPSRTYRGRGWISMGDWLGTGRIADLLRTYRAFGQARAFVRKLGLRSTAEWRNYCKSGSLPPDIPSHPNQTYKNDGWTSMGNWLGTGTVAPRLREFRRFKEARALAQELGLKSLAEWQEYSRSGVRPPDIPSNPARTYKDDGWAGWGDWLRPRTVVPQQRHALAPPFRISGGRLTAFSPRE